MDVNLASLEMETAHTKAFVCNIQVNIQIITISKPRKLSSSHKYY
jgi:hypothetical protein